MSHPNETNYKTIIKDAVSDHESFQKLIFSGSLRGKNPPWIKVLLRPIQIKNALHICFQYFDEKKDISKNYRETELAEKLEELLSHPFNQIHLQTTEADVQIRISKREKVLIKKSKPALPNKSLTLSHNRTKCYPLPAEQPDDFLQFIGIMDAHGKVKPTHQDKFRQINEFLTVIETTLNEQDFAQEKLSMIDCGCGNAHLTLAAYHYLNHIKKIDTRITGIDSNCALMEKCTHLQQTLGWSNIAFHVSKIADFVPDLTPDIVLSLHACDTATDEAIAQGIFWQSRYIFSAPCCQHELRQQIASSLFNPIFKHGILKQRVADILTDACRAQILQIMGYRTNVMEFIDSKHTPKNLMIRAIKIAHSDPSQTIEDYLAIKKSFHIHPMLERLLGQSFQEQIKKLRPDQSI